MDGNNQIIPIATRVSQGETGESWTWFLLKFKECIGEVPNLAIITDRHSAIILACNMIFPNAFHGHCCRHLIMNCKLKSDKLQCIFLKTCKAYTPEEFQRRICDLRGLRPEAYQKLEDAAFETWSRAMCSANRYNYMTSNSAKSINNLSMHVRKSPITMLMEWYRALLQKWYCTRREKYHDSSVHTLSDWATHKVMDRMQKSVNWKVYGIHQAVGRVTGCTDCSDIALGWFRKATLYSTYQELVYPVREPWQRRDGLQVVKPPNMNFPKAGRPKNTDRIKSQDEEPIQVRCSRCGVRGHTRASSHDPIPNYQYEAAYGNNHGGSQEYVQAYNNMIGRSQEYEPTYTNMIGRSQEYEPAYTNNHGRSQDYEPVYNNMIRRSQEYLPAYNNNNGRL
ncbi:transposase, MuDR, MULE transposase domain protein [Tanacetum coccineum]